MTVRNGPLVVSFAAAPGTEPAVLAFAISKKVGNAVTRNRLRRRLREVIRMHVVLQPGVYLLRARPEAAGLSFQDLRSHTVRAFDAVARRAASVTPTTRAPVTAPTR